MVKQVRAFDRLRVLSWKKGASAGARTRVSSVRGWCRNHYTTLAVVRKRCVDLQEVRLIRTMMLIIAMHLKTAVCASCKTTQDVERDADSDTDVYCEKSGSRSAATNSWDCSGYQNCGFSEGGENRVRKILFKRKLRRTPQLQRLEDFYHAKLRTFRGRQRVRICLFSERTGSDLILEHVRLQYGKPSHFLHTPRNRC